MDWLLVVLGFDVVLVIFAIIYILRHPGEPQVMLSWMMLFFLLPILGVVLFLLLGTPKLARMRKRRDKKRKQLDTLELRLQRLQQQYIHPSCEVLPERVRGFITFISHLNKMPPTCNNQVQIYHDGPQALAALCEAISQAQQHIHLEYYAFHADETGQKLAKLLREKARAGVECRVLVDFIGSWGWSRHFLHRLRKSGVEVSYFLPVVPWRGRWRVNFRNHRKIAIIDGLIGFTGSQNIGNEYVGLDKHYQSWHDTHLRLTGPAVHELQDVFVEDWHYAQHQDLSAASYFPPPQPQATGSDNQIVQIFPSGPDMNTRILHHLLLAIISTAQHQIDIATPYFVPDASMVLALEAAAYRNVRVRLLLPNKLDHAIVLWAGRSYYQTLLNAGIQIYEYQRGMVHSKVVIVDDNWGMVGSANMDIRSFRINFELSTLLYNQGLAQQLQHDFNHLLKDSCRILSPQDIQWDFKASLFIGLGRILSPLL
ncbi:cardiolipin synthase [Candidatus Venteria ishoeyi]|uniref:cardiolipin synthase n=1 Tax=Candidatus Venteria ishoeyi TaxID=1899563 RepID=UPI0025A5EC1D|nr:cardiolipin synthase [Candidatus Venteria ishoeyi]MDM8546063.1 cardiolipin synthase [Candidatus Venteria ishoeyi]